MFWEKVIQNNFLYFRKQNFPSSKKKNTLKTILMLEEMKPFNSKLKKLLFLFRRPLRVFHHCFFLLLLLDVFIVNCIYSLRYLLHFNSLLCCCTGSATDLREPFLLSGIFCLCWFQLAFVAPMTRLHQTALLSRLPWSLEFCLECGCSASH